MAKTRTYVSADQSRVEVLSVRKTFLLVEDDPYDVLFVQLEFQRGGVKSNLQVVSDGVEARDYIEGRNEYAGRDKYPMPDVILLDLKLPQMDGFEFLDWLRSQAPDRHRSIPVVVISGTALAEEVTRAGELGANSFLAKPVDWAEYRRQIRALGIYWTANAESPKTDLLTTGAPLPSIARVS